MFNTKDCKKAITQCLNNNKQILNEIENEWINALKKIPHDETFNGISDLLNMSENVWKRKRKYKENNLIKREFEGPGDLTIHTNLQYQQKTKLVSLESKAIIVEIPIDENSFKLDVEIIVDINFVDNGKPNTLIRNFKF